MPCVVSMSVRGATGGTCPAVKSVKHEGKQSNIKQKLNWWREAWFSLLPQNKRIAHLLFPQIFISAEPKRIDIMSAKRAPPASIAFLQSPRPTRITCRCIVSSDTAIDAWLDRRSDVRMFVMWQLEAVFNCRENLCRCGYTEGQSVCNWG